MLNENIPKIVRPFLNKRVTVQTFGGEITIEGDLIYIDKSLHGGNLGNIVIENHGGLVIVRGDALQLMFLENGSHKRVRS